MKQFKYKQKSIGLLAGLVLLIGLNQTASAQFAGNLWGMMTIGDPITLINGDLMITSTGKLFMGPHSPRGLQTNMLSITGNYAGEEGSQIYVSVADNSNLPNTHGYIDIVGTATRSNGATLIVLDYFNASTGWDGSCIDLIRANKTGSDTETFRMESMTLNSRTAVLRHRTYDNSMIWYLAQKLIISQHTPAQSSCQNEPVDPFSVITATPGNYTYQWYRCDANGSNLINLGSANGAQTPEYKPAFTTAGISYYRCVVTSLACNYNTDTTAVSGAVAIGSSIRIISQPADYFVCNSEGNKHTVLSVVAEGDNITYQWYKNDIPVPGANEPDLDIELTKGLIDQYYVEIQGCGTIRSEAAYVGFSLDVILQKMNSTLVINNNANTNGGYNFVYYTWYKDGQRIAGGSHDNLQGHYYANGDLDPDAEYWAEMTDINGKHYRTCPYTPVIHIKINILAYPNTVASAINRVVTVDIEGISPEELNSATIDMYSSLGAYMGRERVQGRNRVPVTMPNEPGAYILQFKSATEERNIKIIVE